jgi:DNA-binding transcriptional LysR family regulator
MADFVAILRYREKCHGALPLSGDLLTVVPMGRRYHSLPSLTALVAFEAAARHLSIKEAAAELSVTPGALSRQIKALEEEAGCALFTRGHRSIALTFEGETLQTGLTSSFRDIADIFSRVRARGVERATVTLGSYTAFTQFWVMPRLGGFFREHPEITVNHVISDNNRDLMRATIDLRISYGTGHWPGQSDIYLYTDRLYPVCGPGFANGHRATNLAELTRLPLLLVEGLDPDWTGWEHWLRQFGQRTRALNTRSFNSYVVTMQAALDDQGVALGWDSFVRPMINEGKLVRLTDLDLTDSNSFYITWAEDRSLSPEARILRDWFVAAAKSS